MTRQVVTSQTVHLKLIDVSQEVEWWRWSRRSSGGSFYFFRWYMVDGTRMGPLPVGLSPSKGPSVPFPLQCVGTLLFPTQ